MVTKNEICVNSSVSMWVLRDVTTIAHQENPLCRIWKKIVSLKIYDKMVLDESIFLMLGGYFGLPGL